MFLESGLTNGASGAKKRMPRLVRMNKGGQALVELAVFGSILILLMGTLLTYGLKYDLQQQADQQAFRRALWYQGPSSKFSASTVSYSIQKMRHVPDPADPFGFGSVTYASGSGTVTWDWNLGATPEGPNSLPVSIMDVQANLTDGQAGWEHKEFYMAGYRDVANVDPDNIDRYEQIFGFISYLQTDNTSWGSADNALMVGGTWNPMTYTYVDQDYAAIRIIDSCTSNLVDYDSCYTQSRMIVDSSFCAKECEANKTAGSEVDCNAACSGTVDIPWYATGYSATGTDPDGYTLYNFPGLSQIFSTYESMGAQSDPTTDVVKDSTFRVRENPTQIRTDETASWTQTTSMPFVYNDNVPGPGESGAGVDQGIVNVVPWNEVSQKVVSETSSQTWITTK